ncbi:hypothetical protein SAMN05444141_101204 [Pseudovibrio denitrificans]|uniref:Uncharacterized protein n=1 Tax=Pseudovibrio denitrificans TaxID=258256 RepID=A0A1I6XHD6_9HYPH|nr:hypothetical protein [Pseudovibrio denitrificans]SFT37828.1 hypothetical protein SAMN05444141_101204 [Pseudovibrio denitrificans]
MKEVKISLLYLNQYVSRYFVLNRTCVYLAILTGAKRNRLTKGTKKAPTNRLAGAHKNKED